MHKSRIVIIIILILAASAYLVWYLVTPHAKGAENVLSGSGTVETTAVTISTEMFGRVAEVLVEEGDQVEAGDLLVRLDDSLLSAQLNQAQINLKAAQAGMEVANDSYDAAMSGVDIAQAQYNLTLAQALQQAQPARSIAWSQGSPAEFDLPSWYYSPAEQIKAALDELNLAKTTLEDEQSSFNELQSSDAYTNLAATETRLAKARAAFLDAQDVLNRAQQQDNQSLIDFAQQAHDEAQTELDDAQKAYNELLDSQAAAEILDRRAKLAVAQERYNTAQDRYNALLTGKDSLQVQVASASLAQAQAGVTLAQTKISQAQLAVEQARAALDLIHIQMDKLSIMAPVGGVVLARNIEPGEVIQPGATALTLGEVENLTITVYIPENRYGEVHLGDRAQVRVDSFPSKYFEATVTRIAEQAEFTPRNVQTMEGRSTTVYAIQLAVQNPDKSLKPGMPADVTFTRP